MKITSVPTRNVLGYDLLQTCAACPEQYDVFMGKEIVGYLRLRHGYFTAEAMGCGRHDGNVYEAKTKGDGLFTEDERDEQLHAAIWAIDAARRRYLDIPPRSQN